MLAIIRKHYLNVAQFFRWEFVKRVLILLIGNTPGNEVVYNVKEPV